MSKGQLFVAGAIVGPLLWLFADVILWILGAGVVVWAAITYLEIAKEEQEKEISEKDELAELKAKLAALEARNAERSD